MTLELDKGATNIKLYNADGKVALKFDRPNKNNCIYITQETNEMEIKNINENTVTLIYKIKTHGDTTTTTI